MAGAASRSKDGVNMFRETVVIGHLGRDVELRYKESGEAYARFSVAANEFYGGEDHTTWYNVTVWSPKIAEACNQHLRKGSLVFLKGTDSARAYTTSGGEARASLDLNARVVKFLQKAGDSPQQGDEEEIPF